MALKRFTIIFVYFGILFVYVTMFKAESTCDIANQCPSHLPYCTNAGCAYECPDNFYVNGSTCVLLCRDWFVNATGHCQESCPDNFFVRNNVKSIGQDILLEKQCLFSCSQSEFIFNLTCLKACPEEFKYISNNVCVAYCPSDTLFLLNLTQKDLLNHECRTSCPIFDEENYCVDRCSAGKMLFGSSCLEFCPESHKIIRHSYPMNECVDKCDDWMFVVNGTCDYACTEEFPFLYDKTCLSNCPVVAPYLCHKDCQKWSAAYNICLTDCPKSLSFKSNNTCTSSCEYVSVNKTCLPECPVDAPFTKKVTDCTGDKCMNPFWYLECIPKCEPNQFVISLNKSCVDICPENMTVYNLSCLDKCPINVPYMRMAPVSFTTTMYRQVGNWYNTYFEKRVVSKTEDRIHCDNACNEAELEYNFTCFRKCPTIFKGKELLYFNNTCLERCPKSHPFISKMSIGESCDPSWICASLMWYFECVEACPNHLFTSGNLCLDYCSEPLFHYNSLCVDTCPEQTYPQTYKHEYKTWRFNSRYYVYGDYSIYPVKKCVVSCEDSVLYNNSCQPNCPSAYNYILDGKCTSHCPDNYVLQHSFLGIQCLLRCPKYRIKGSNRTCVEGCTDPLKYNYDGECVAKCPSSKPFGQKDRFVSFVCISKCEEDKVFKLDEEECISEHECKGEYFIFDQQCLRECPIEYLWFLSCFHKIAAIVAASVLGGLLIIYIQQFSRRYKETYYFLKACLNQKKITDEFKSQYYSLFLTIPEQQDDPMNVTNISSTQCTNTPMASEDTIELQIFENEGFVC